MRTLLLLSAVAVTACSQQEPGQVPTTNGTGGTFAGLPTGTTTPGGTTTGTTTDSTIPLPEFDCATIPNTPTEVNLLGAPRGYHDVAFTTDGKIIGSDDGFWNVDFLRVDDQDNTEVLIPDLGITQQSVWLPDGDLAVATDQTGAIIRVDSAGAVSIIKPNVGAYGLIMGPDDMLWAANYQEVMRIDPATGASETILSSLPSGQPRVINFNRDNTRLYIGTLFGNGDIFYVDLDANYMPTGPAQTLASGVGSGSYHDGLGVDICGYIYMPDYSTSAMYRISPSGDQVQNIYDTPLSEYGHGLEWGNGVGPWRTDAIYIPLPYGGNQVIELVIGVPTVWEGTVINAPAQP